MSRARGWWRTVAVGIAAALVVTACGGDDAGSDDTSSGEATSSPGGTTGNDDSALDATGFIGGADAGEPVTGGRLTFAVFSGATTLDPARAPDSGLASTEMAAIYDALMRYDPQTATYEPWQAESLEPNNDFTEWTLTLRPGITFSDGTPLDSAAVALQMQRTQQNRKGNYTDIVERVETPDPLTAVYHLAKGWAGFAYALSVNPGRIPSPTAVAAGGDDYGTEPVGAGAFVLDHWAPGEELVVTAREDYWDGRPPLDSIRFTVLPNDQTRLDTMRGGDADAGFLRVPSVVHDAADAGMGGFVNVLNVGEVLVINNGIDGRDTPGDDVRVRQAIALALDPVKLNETVNGGQGLWSKDVFGSSSTLHGDVAAVGTDPTKAASLVEAAKADGFGGTLTLTCDSSPERERQALALQAQLTAVGFEVVIDRVPSVVDTIRKVFSERAFDIACYGYSWQDNAPFVGASLLTSGPHNALGFGDPSVDAAIDALRQAATPAETVAGIDLLQQGFNELQPYVPLAAVRELIAWNTDVHGIDVSAFTVPVFTDAWIER